MCHLSHNIKLWQQNHRIVTELRAYINIESFLGDTNTQIQIDLRKVYEDYAPQILLSEDRVCSSGKDDDLLMMSHAQDDQLLTPTKYRKIIEVLDETPHIMLNLLANRIESKKGNDVLGMRKLCSRWIPA